MVEVEDEIGNWGMDGGVRPVPTYRRRRWWLLLLVGGTQRKGRKEGVCILCKNREEEIRK